MLSQLPQGEDEGLLVGHGTNDDAAVLKIDGDRAIVQTVDFFTPIVDDPFLFGSIAAANSISDIYAMGAEPILGLAIAAFPTDKLPLSVLQKILEGGAAKAHEAGFPIGGGHTIIDDVPKYGLAVTGVVPLDRVVRNSTAQAGDILYLTKPIGNGILVSAHRAMTTGGRIATWMRRAPHPKLDEAIDWMVKLNRDAARIMISVGVRAATDVTGYGLIGHLLEMCRGAGVGAQLSCAAVPVLPGARELLQRGFVPAGTLRNAAAFRKSVDVKAADEEYTLLADAQTSGGLLMAVAPGKARLLEEGFSEQRLLCARIGEVNDRSGRIELVP